MTLPLQKIINLTKLKKILLRLQVSNLFLSSLVFKFQNTALNVEIGRADECLEGQTKESSAFLKKILKWYGFSWITHSKNLTEYAFYQ